MTFWNDSISFHACHYSYPEPTNVTALVPVDGNIFRGVFMDFVLWFMVGTIILHILEINFLSDTGPICFHK